MYRRTWMNVNKLRQCMMGSASIRAMSRSNLNAYSNITRIKDTQVKNSNILILRLAGSLSAPSFAQGSRVSTYAGRLSTSRGWVSRRRIKLRRIAGRVEGRRRCKDPKRRHLDQHHEMVAV